MNAYVITIATIIAIYAVVVCGLNVIVGYAGQISLGHAAFFGIGAYITGILTVSFYPFETGFTVALITATVVTAVIGILLGIPTLHLRGDYLALVTLGFGEVVRFSLRSGRPARYAPSRWTPTVVTSSSRRAL